MRMTGNGQEFSNSKPGYSTKVDGLKPQGSDSLVEQSLEATLMQNPDGSASDVENGRPAGVGFLLQKARELRDCAEFDEEISYLMRATALMPTDPEIWRTIGKAYTALQDRESAYEAYLRVEALAPNDREAIIVLAMLTPSLEESISLYARCIALDPDFGFLYQIYGDRLIELNKLQEALQAYEKASSLGEDVTRPIALLKRKIKEQQSSANFGLEAGAIK